VACELDVAAAIYLQNEEMTRDVEREKRDREFWMAMLGSEAASNSGSVSGEGMALVPPSFDQSHATRW
jgi:hypothetical protein